MRGSAAGGSGGGAPAPPPPPIFADDPSARAAQEALYEEQTGRKLRRNGGAGDAAAAEAQRFAERKRLIVLSTEGERINTGVWPGWGGAGGAAREVTLNWAAAGVRVQKYCPLACTITHDNSLIAQADAVVMELVNHPKFGLGGQPVQWPERSRPNARAAAAAAAASGVPATLPLLGLFYYEPTDAYPAYGLGDADVAARFDFTMTHQQSTTLPVTLVCPWGRPVEDFLRPMPAKGAGRLVAYFSEHGAAVPFRQLLDELFEAAGAQTGAADNGLHAYTHRRNRETPAEAGGDPYQLSRRVDFMGTYKFLLITEGSEEADFLSPEWSQAFLAGAVPVYLGAPNVEQYAPGPRSFVSARDFASGAELWAYLSSFAPAATGDEAADAAAREAADAAYARFFEWKKGARAAYGHDEAGTQFAVGTGGALVKDAEWPRPKADVARDLNARWPLPLKAGATGREEEADAEAAREFETLASWGWRLFRERLDNCVHYAECRLCKLVWDRT